MIYSGRGHHQPFVVSNSKPTFLLHKIKTLQDEASSDFDLDYLGLNGKRFIALILFGLHNFFFFF